MSYPPQRPQMMPPPFGYGMPPMMGMPPPLMHPGMVRPGDPSGGEKAPVTTVFVGNISDRVPDPMIRSMLQRCGTVNSWKRVQGANGKLQAFGFCEYDNPEATLRCIRLLNEYEIADRKLTVKVDQKTRELLCEYKWKRKKQADINSGKKPSERPADITQISLESVDEDTLKEDRVTIGQFENILRQYAKDLFPEAVVEASAETQKTVESDASAKTDTKIKLNDVHVDADKKELISGEIQSFREKHKGDEVKSKEKERNVANDRRDRRVRTPPHRSRSRDRERERDVRRRSPAKRSSKSPLRARDTNGATRHADETEEEYELRKLDRKLREKELAYRERLREWELREAKRARLYADEKRDELNRRKNLAKEGKKLKQFLEDYDDEKDDSNFYKGASLAKKLKLREREIELDNRDRMREKDEIDELKRKLVKQGHETDVEEQLRKIQEDEKVRLKSKLEALASSSHSESSSDENSENEADAKEVASKRNGKVTLADFAPSVQKNGLAEQKAKEENEYKKNITDEKMDQDEIDEASKVKFDIRDEDSNARMDFGGPGDELKRLNSFTDAVDHDTPMDDDTKMSDDNTKDSLSPVHLSDDNSMQMEPSSSNMSPLSIQSPNSNVFPQSNSGFFTGAATKTVTIKKQVIKTKSIQPINQAFAEEEDDEQSNLSQNKRAKLSSMQAQLNAEERKKAVKKLVESIPTDRDQLFKYEIDWDQLDQTLMDKRIKPWVNKKIVDYIGEEEATLNEFICAKIMERIQPDKLMEDIKVILDEEAELFVKKTWRLIVYETESKRLGLSK